MSGCLHCSFLGGVVLAPITSSISTDPLDQLSVVHVGAIIGDMGLYSEYVSGKLASPMNAGSAQDLSDHDRLILDLERKSPSPEDRRSLCARIDLKPERYAAVLDGLADLDAAYAYAPDIVRTIREARSERFRFSRRGGRWRLRQKSLDRREPE